MSIRNFFLFSALVFFLPAFHAQKSRTNNNEALAIQYYEQKEFEKANVYFEELYERKPAEYFHYYYQSLIETAEYSKAEKLTRKHLRYNKYDAYLYVYLGRIHRLKEEPKKEKEAYEKAISELLPVQPYIHQLALAFMAERLYDHAIAVYNKGRRNSPDYPYFYERAEVYKAKNDINSMINEYLDALEFRETELHAVQTNLQNSLGYDDDEGGIKNPILKQQLQKRIQKNPQKIVLTEFLVFIQKQQKDFEGAFIQSRALDKRLKEDGQRIYELAKICVSNEDWETARKCYSYLIEKGTSGVYYDIATIEGLNVDFLWLTKQPQPRKEDLVILEQNLEKANQKYGNSFLNTSLLRNLAFIKAYYLHKAGEAVALLGDFIKRPALDPVVKAEHKLLLADIYLVSGEIWEASLLYSQVEKDFKYEAIGQDAKFRNARLSYYAGDFTWSKAQADVLKGATSKLIANDALDLSLIISDAIGVDTNDLPLKLFASAELMVLEHRYNEAIARMDSINILFSEHTLGDDISYKKAVIYKTLGQYKDAEAMYKHILEYYPEELYGDDAQFMLAELYEKHLNDSEKARKAYEQVMVGYPGSIFTVEARKRYRQLRGDILNN
jgi:tetratricopeptide (TPR) repeat protein